MFKKNFPHSVFLLNTRYISGASNGVMDSPSFTQCEEARRFHLVQRGLRCGSSSCGKFRPPYTRADSEIAAPACILAYMKKKKKKSLWRRLKWGWATIKLRREKENGNNAGGNIMLSTEFFFFNKSAFQYLLLKHVLAEADRLL